MVMRLCRWPGLLLCATMAAGFVAQHGSPRRVLVLSQAAKKGFAAPKPERPKSAGKQEKERAAAAYDAAKASGVPEYRVYVKPKDTPDGWLAVGCVTVPRAEPVDRAIFANLEALQNAAFRAHPQLRSYANEDALDYGYNLAVFPDDPVRLAKQPQSSTNPVAGWIKDLTNPVNTRS